MASRKQDSFDKQNMDEMGVKDELVKINSNQGNPYAAKARDFPDGKTSANVGHGQGSGADYNNPHAGGYDELVKQSENQEGPRNAEANMEGGGAEDDSMAERASMVAANFKVSRNSGESSSQAQKPDIPESINILEGHIEVRGVKQSRVMEVPDRQVCLG